MMVMADSVLISLKVEVVGAGGGPWGEDTDRVDGMVICRFCL